MGNLEEFKKTVWIFLSVSHSLEQKENKMLCCNQIMFSEALCWQVHNSFTTSIKTEILRRKWQHFQMERRGAQKHHVSPSQLLTWWEHVKKYPFSHWNSTWLSLMVKQNLGTEVWTSSCTKDATNKNPSHQSSKSLQHFLCKPHPPSPSSSSVPAGTPRDAPVQTSKGLWEHTT